MPSLQWLIYSPDCHDACCGLDSAAILFLAPLGQIATSPSFVSLNAQRLFSRVHYVTETIGFPCATIRRSRSLMRVAVFRSGSCTNTRIRGGKLLFISRIVATHLMRLYLHAPLSEMKRARKNAVHRYFWRRLHAIHTVLLRRDLSCSQSNSYEFRKSIARDLQLIVVSRLCNCSGRESQRSPLRLPSFYKTKALNQPTQSGDWRVRSLVHSPDRVINL